MAFVSATPFTVSSPLTGLVPGVALPSLDSVALARLGQVSPSVGAPVLQQRGPSLEVQLMALLLRLMVSSPALGGSSSGVAPVAGGSSMGDAPAGATPAQPEGKSSYNVASFNVLGASHTGAGGNKPGFASAEQRMKGAVDALQSHNVDIAGLQEFQGPQQQQFKKLAPGFDMFADGDNAIVWNAKKFRAVEKRTVTIPYFEGNPRKMPVVQLEDKSTGKRMWIINIHNPADTKDHPRNAANRARAVQIEQNLVRELRASGLPVMIVGDFNEGKSVDADMEKAGLQASAPKGARTGVDWIFGSEGVQFSNYSFDQSTKKSGTSDHPLVVSTATI